MDLEPETAAAPSEVPADEEEIAAKPAAATTSTRFLRDFLCMYLDEKSRLQKTLILCLLRAFISKANGHKNPQYDPKVKSFMLAVAATNKQACELLTANLNPAGERTIRRWSVHERAKPIILNEEADIICLLVKRFEMIRVGLGKDATVTFSAGGDATKLVKGFGYLHQANMIVGGLYPRATSEPNEHFYGLLRTSKNYW